MGVFDYFYYRFASFYIDQFGEGGTSSAAIVLSLAQCLNILVLFIIFMLFTGLQIYASPIVIILIGTCVMYIFNSIRYRKSKSFQELSSKWRNEESVIKKRRGYIIILYFIVSLIMAVVFLNLHLSMK